MVTVYNITPYSLVLDWNKRAVPPGGSVEVTPEQAATLSPTYWSEIAPKASAPAAFDAPTPVKPVRPSAPAKADDAPTAVESANSEEDK